MRGLVRAIVAAAVVVLVAWLFFASIAFVLALVGPALGLAFGVWQLRVALALWKSHGRVPIAEGVRVYSASRLRALALLHVGSGVGAVALGASPTALLFGHSMLAALLGGGGAILLAGSGAGARKLMSEAKSIDILPPEG